MKRILVFFISLISMALVFVSQHRMIMIALSTANLVVLTSHAGVYDTKAKEASADDQTANATQPVVNPAISMGGMVVNGIVSSLSNGSGQKKGLQFKDPVVSVGTAYRSTDDTTLGGFQGNEYSGDVGFDVDVYDGLITGLIYQHTYRGAHNTQGTSENLNSDGVSLYAAKRFFDLMNTGVAYNHAATEHRLTRAANVNLDRDSDGFTVFLGASDRKDKWSWNTTTSFGYVHDEYDQRVDPDTGIFSWGGGLNYDVTKIFTLGAAFNYVNFVIQDKLPNGSVRDDDYWTLGPRLRFYPTDNITLNLDFDSEQGYSDYRAYLVRLGVNVAF